MKCYYKSVIAIWLSTTCAVGMELPLDNSDSSKNTIPKLSVRVLNINLQQLPNDSDRTNVIIVSHGDQVKDIVPLPDVGEEYIFFIYPSDFGKGKKIQLAQIDSDHSDIHNDIPWPVEVSNDSTLFSDRLTIKIQDSGSLGQYGQGCLYPEGSYYYTKLPTKIDFVVGSERDDRLLNLLEEIIGDGKFNNEYGEFNISKLYLLSRFLNKFYPPIYIEHKDKELDIELNTENRSLMKKYETYTAWEKY